MMLVHKNYDHILNFRTSVTDPGRICFLADLAEGNVSFCHYTASVEC